MENCKKETTPYGVALNKVLRTDLIFHLLDYRISAALPLSTLRIAHRKAAAGLTRGIAGR